MAVNLMLILRGVQAALALIILGLSAAVINNFLKFSIGSPDVINFMLFCSIWTFLVLAYICFAPSVVPQLHNQYGVLAAEVITTIFWFAGWIATAAWISPFQTCANSMICGASKAAAAMGAFEWVAFMISSFLVVRAFLHTRKGAGAATPGTEMPPGTNNALPPTATQSASGNPEQHKEGSVVSEPDGVPVRIPSPEEFGGREVV